MMKKFFTFLVLLSLLVGYTTKAAVVTSSFTGTDTNQIYEGRSIVSSVQVANATAATLTLTLYDGPAAAGAGDLLFVIPTYTIVSNYTTSVVTTFTNFSGVVQNQTNDMRVSTNVTIPQTTNTYATLMTISVAASTTSTTTPNNPLYTGMGLVGTSDTNATVTVTYNPF